MNGVLKMAQLDNRSMSARSVYITLLFVLLALSFLDMTISTATLTVAWLMALNLMLIFSVQEANGLNRLYASLTLNDGEVVGGRYLYCFVHFLVGIVIATVICSVSFVLEGGNWPEIGDLLIAYAVSFLAFTVIISIQIPIFFTVGYAKGVLFAMVPYLAVLLVVIASVFSDDTMRMVGWLLAHPLLLLALSLLFSAVMLVVSYRSSLKAYKEFH